MLCFIHSTILFLSAFVNKKREHEAMVTYIFPIVYLINSVHYPGDNVIIILYEINGCNSLSL